MHQLSIQTRCSPVEALTNPIRKLEMVGTLRLFCWFWYNRVSRTILARLSKKICWAIFFISKIQDGRHFQFEKRAYFFLLLSKLSIYMFLGCRFQIWGLLWSANSIETFLATSEVILKVKRPYFKVKLVNFGHFCQKLSYRRAKDLNSGSKHEFLRTVDSIATSSKPTEIIFKVKKSHFQG